MPLYLPGIVKYIHVPLSLVCRYDRPILVVYPCYTAWQPLQMRLNVTQEQHSLGASLNDTTSTTIADKIKVIMPNLCPAVLPVRFDYQVPAVELFQRDPADRRRLPTSRTRPGLHKLGAISGNADLRLRWLWRRRSYCGCWW